MYFKFSSLFIDFKKKGRNFATFFKFINLSGLHSHSFDVSTHLFKNFIAESDQTESKQKDDFIEEWD